MVGEMTNGGRIRQSFAGARDLTSTEGSEYGPVEFTREDVDALLHERIKYKSKYNYKVDLSLCSVWVFEIDFSQFHAIYQNKVLLLL